MKKQLWSYWLFAGLASTVSAAQTVGTPAPACSAAAYHAFDFWLGTWDVYDAANNSLTAHASITRVEGGCAVREEYRGLDGSGGESLSAWDAARSVWRQNWVSDKGAIVALEGNLQDGAMVLSGPERGTHKPDLVRGTWSQEGVPGSDAKAGGVHEVGERSTDGGHTWQPWFDLHFQPASAATAAALAARASSQADQVALAGLDDQYQDAVKRNDAMTMGRLLAPGFILMTGAGEIYTRAHLLADATSGTVTYTHQEDSQRAVRIYGDTAIVTALLWEAGTDAGQPFDRKVWFSDTWVRTVWGWQYVFGQSSLALPEAGEP
jgi:hypothetical protein